MTLAAISSTVDPVASRVSWKRPLRLSKIRGIGVEKTGIVMRMADAIHNDQRISVRLQGEKSSLSNDDGYLVVRGDRKSTRLNSSHSGESRMPSSA